MSNSTTNGDTTGTTPHTTETTPNSTNPTSNSATDAVGTKIENAETTNTNNSTDAATIPAAPTSSAGPAEVVTTQQAASGTLPTIATKPPNCEDLSPHTVLGWSIADHLDARRRGISAVTVIGFVLEALAQHDDPALLIGEPLFATALAQAQHIDDQPIDTLPLHGVPFLVKDNIDVAGVPTSCGCPTYAYLPEHDAEVVARLRAAGAIPVGKTNLDQFATGLVGTRSPHGTPRNPLNAALVPGGSSSGSGVGVAVGFVPFSLGTDTAGSGRVPAAMCGIVGLKPTVGRLPSRGMVPAVRRIDCPTVFARTVGDARIVAALTAGWDTTDPYSRPANVKASAVRTIGIPGDFDALANVLTPEALRAYESVIAEVRSSWDTAEFDLAPFLEAGQLLYGGTFVAERTAAVGTFLATSPADADPTVAKIINAGQTLTAVAAYQGEYRLAELRAATESTWNAIDAMLLPTIPGAISLADVAADPIGANTRNGTFTTFTNLLDLAAIAIPLGLTRAPEDTAGGAAAIVPFGVQLIGPAWTDEALADAAQLLLGEPLTGGFVVRPGEQSLVVVGAHLSGMPLNGQLTSRHARLLGTTTTSPNYRLYALPGTVPPKPGLRRVTAGSSGTESGAAIVVEVWALSTEAFGSFVSEIPSPLGIGTVELADGSFHKGFICEPFGLDGSTDITHHGGWRAYRAAETKA
jgi:allophanate hydrolase